MRRVMLVPVVVCYWRRGIPMMKLVQRVAFQIGQQIGMMFRVILMLCPTKKKKKAAKILHGSTSSNKSGRSNSSLRGVQVSSEEYRQGKEEEICEPKAGLSNMMEQMASFIQGMQQQSRTGFQGIDVGSGAQDKQHPHTQGSSVASHENEQQGKKTI